MKRIALLLSLCAMASAMSYHPTFRPFRYPSKPRPVAKKPEPPARHFITKTTYHAPVLIYLFFLHHQMTVPGVETTEQVEVLPDVEQPRERHSGPMTAVHWWTIGLVALGLGAMFVCMVVGLYRSAT